MALVQCPECGREMSDKAAQCPGCGYAVETEEPVKRRSRVPALILVGCGLIVLSPFIVLLLGVFATLFVPTAIETVLEAKIAQAKNAITAIESACQNYAIANSGHYPGSLEELVMPDEMGFTFLKGEKVPFDPWGNEYLYEPPGAGRSLPTISCLGSDGASGGEGDARDFDNHMITAGDF